MAIIIDRRYKRDHNTENKRKFLKKQKSFIKEQLDDIVAKSPIKDFLKNKPMVRSKKKGMKEPFFNYDIKKGKHTVVSTGNKDFNKGERLPIIRSPASGRGASKDGEGEDIFYFTLTHEEFLDFFFEGCGLPNYTKKSIQELEKAYRRSGYSKEGTPSRLNLKKTFENSLARRIASKKAKAKVVWLDDIDLRYNYFAKKYIPSRKAVMFCIMDVSGSMAEIHKLIAKKFFILLHLFLTKNYSSVELVFITHHSVAQEVTEHDFFYSRVTGGTVVSNALALTHEIIKERYNPAECNIYVTQVSDDDNWQEDNELCVSIIKNQLLPLLQYFIYLNVRQSRDYRLNGDEGLWNSYMSIKEKNFTMHKIPSDDLIWHTFLEIFGKK